MKSKIAIYLAGSIKKGHERSDESFWTENDMVQLKAHLDKHEVSFLNPAFRTDDLSDSLSVFGRDMLQVFSSNFVLVDARDRRGLGVGAEMMWAKINKIPVITWAPRNSHYHKDQAILLDVPVSDFVHPFVYALSDKVAENLLDAAQWIDALLSNPTVEVKGAEYIGAAMQYYKECQFDRDLPMKELLTSNEALIERMNRSLPQVISI